MHEHWEIEIIENIFYVNIKYASKMHYDISIDASLGSLVFFALVEQLVHINYNQFTVFTNQCDTEDVTPSVVEYKD